MGALLDGLPTAIFIEGEVYEINAAYHNCLRIILAFEDSSLTGAEKGMLLLELLYRKQPPNVQLAIEKGIQFLDCGEKSSGVDGQASGRRYSFTHDERYIFSAVDRVLLGRLSKGDFVHWWEFVMAFMEMPEDCTMSRILYFRMQFEKGKLTKEERQAYYENRNLFELPMELTAEDEMAEAMFMERLGK